MNNLKEMADKNINDLNKKRAVSEVYMKGIVEESKSIIHKAEKRVNEINTDLQSLKMGLEKEVFKDEKSSDYEDKKKRYEKLLSERETLEKAVTVASETIATYELKYLPEE